MLYTLRLRLGLACLAVALSAGPAQAITINTPNVTITDGEIDEIVLLTGATNFTLSGGTIFGDFTALNGTSAAILGGDIQGDLLVPGVGAVVEIFGSGFLVNGSDVFPAVLTADFCEVTGCLIEGTLNDGQPFSIQGYPVRSGEIRLVPEPRAALLLGAGLMGLAFVGRRPKRAPRRR